MTRRTCESRRFYRTEDDCYEHGECRRTAPAASARGRWPVMNYYDWCGNWKAGSNNQSVEEAKA